MDLIWITLREFKISSKSVTVIRQFRKLRTMLDPPLFWRILDLLTICTSASLFEQVAASTLSTYNFSTLYTTLSHNLFKDKLVDLIERIFQREGSLYIAYNNRNAFFTSGLVRTLAFLLDNIYIRFGSKFYIQIVGIPMGTNCAPLIVDLFLLCYERDFMLSLSEDNKSGVIEAFNYTSRYPDKLLNIDNKFFDSMVNHIYPSMLHLNKANVSNSEASF